MVCAGRRWRADPRSRARRGESNETGCSLRRRSS